ncbi:MAG TPA: hypothetical protein DEG17_19130 [Cyanobacteria bacterium UBA11149]|nr:hypothetical protein [Cyanobacteria bacterium UBA11367]HBE57187.1 hypothetical protein [Cyanobacteria bacterium UBA11366]HBK64019.1 hypothetical protein [Cyanobacteria bacterium UBA11166]HBR74155.1 hypothetical protein [Cyanobacteria bacterium UBA11159]HBS71481.1 hypothetical protein [Cyanobacteria bacterium UBA11153]HBW90922.1 hypothetical protein [Cyanobacteria bacterium UBA11149]HCA93554.1 hypothetical protein [Cyanobacteria bacterium UBA9226]
MNQSQPLPYHSIEKTSFHKSIRSIYQTPIALAVLLLGLILTGFSWQYTKRNIERETTAQMDKQVKEATISIQNRIQVYLNTFYAGKGFWISENLNVPYNKWQIFVTTLELEKRYPGINGLGFIRYIPKNLKEYEKKVRQNNNKIEKIYQNYTVYPQGKRPDYFVIEYSEPIQKNRQAIGLDVGHETVRRKGVERARDTGNPAATGRIILVQDKDKTPGFLMYLPIYRPGMPINTIEEKKAAFFGFIYAPFRVLDLVEEGLPKSVKQNFDLVIYNGKDLMYGKPDNLSYHQTPSHPRYYREIVIDVAGETWNLYFTSKSNLTVARDNLPPIVLAVGTLTSLLLFGIILSLSMAYRQTKAAKEISDAAKEAAETANKAKSIFLANMSHELRTPLNAILGFSQIMNRDSSLKEEQIENLSIISRSGEHLLSLINDVLNMSKIEAGRTILTPNIFDIYEMLNIIEEMFQSRAEAKGIQLIFNCDLDIPKYVFADESKLRQILINLLSNSIKFTEEGKVTLRVFLGNSTEVDSNKELINFEVEDTGYGIKPEELKTLFDTFVQTETGRHSQEGTGLGLAISQKFAQLMGGKITVSSTFGKGTIFRFDIPVEIAKSSEIKSTQPTSRVIHIAPNQPTYRILVVDDRWENRQVLSKLLRAVGFQVKEAVNGEEAVTISENWQPHLIWMDMRMPVMNGYEATQRIKATQQDIIIIALTASAFEEERSQILAHGCNDYLRKPFQESVIFAKMAQYLGVEYIYDPQIIKTQSLEILQTDKEEIPTEGSLLLEISQMPLEWVAQLHQTANQLNVKRTLKLIQQIPPEYSQLAIALTNWVNGFHFDEISNLTQTILDRHGHGESEIRNREY